MTKSTGAITLCSLLLLLVVVPVVFARLLEGQRAFYFCKKQERVTLDDLREIQNKTIPTNTTGKCFLACMMEKSHFMKDGKYDLEYALKITDGTLKYRKTKLNEARMKISTCANQTDALTDRCELAVALAQCFRTHSQQLQY